MGLSVEKVNGIFEGKGKKKLPPVITGELEEEKKQVEEVLDEEDGEEELEYTKEQMLERGYFEANDYIFDVRPITFFESMEIFNDKKVWIPSRYDQNGEEFTDQELGRMFMRFFKKKEPEQREATQVEAPSKTSLFKRKKSEQESVDYSQYPDAWPMIKWLERKVSYEGEPIKFTELETKFLLTKGEIVNLLIYLFEMSGF